MEMMRSYYEVTHTNQTREAPVQVAYDKILSDDCSCSLSGCEFDYQTNTYRLQVIRPAREVPWISASLTYSNLNITVTE
jgi:hypothetical protein